MREIKFRIWDPKHKEMVPPEGEGFTLGDFAMGLYPIGLCNESSFRDDLVLMQYTGLEDKNGKSIYEGDILDKSYHNLSVYTGKGVVELGEGSDSDGWNHESWLGWKAGDSSLLDVHNEASVLGNIYENPELLEQN